MGKKHFALITMLATVATCAFGQTSRASASGPFDKIWSVAFSQFDQSDQWANSITQLTNGTLVAVGADGGNQPNSCRGFFGGAWLIAVTPAGNNVFQKLYSDCANAGAENAIASASGRNNTHRMSEPSLRK